MNYLQLIDIIFWASYVEGQVQAITGGRRPERNKDFDPRAPYFAGYKAGLASKGVIE